MKQFYLEEYLANPSRKIVVRDGRKVKRILCTDAAGPYPIVALVENNIGGIAVDNAYHYTVDGRYITGETDDKDLFFAHEKHEGWVNLLKDLNGNSFIGDPCIFESKEKAEEEGKTCSNYIATIKIELEE